MIRAFRGEFGLKVRWHVPQAHALMQDRGPVPVEVEAGEEALYPLASEYRVVGRASDDSRHGRPRPLYRREARFQPEPHVPQGVTCDIVICPRWRRYGAGKNWPHWHTLAALPGVFAAGAPDSSAEVDCPRAWDYARFLDASIEALRSARLCIATDAGLAHLAVLCGTPLLLITHEGRVAPGPVVTSSGRRVHARYWPVRLDEYYQRANHTNAPITMVDAWHHPDRVIEWAAGVLA